MKVKEYLVNRILDLEKDLKQLRNEKAGTTYGLQKLQEDVLKLNEKIEQYQMEREHIKEIITCNIEGNVRKGIYLSDNEKDFDTLMAILDIKLTDYTDMDIDICDRCVFEDVDGDKHPCNQCNDGSEFVDKEVTTDAKTKD